MPDEETLTIEQLQQALKDTVERDNVVIESLRDQVQVSRDTEMAATHAYERLGDKLRVAMGSLLRIAGPEFVMEFQGVAMLAMGAQTEAKAALEQCKWGGQVAEDGMQTAPAAADEDHG